MLKYASTDLKDRLSRQFQAGKCWKNAGKNAGKIDEMELRSSIVGTGKRLMPLTILCTMGNLI